MRRNKKRNLTISLIILTKDNWSGPIVAFTCKALEMCRKANKKAMAKQLLDRRISL
jgi:hypothetical protein